MSYTNLSFTTHHATGSTATTAAKEDAQINPVGKPMVSGKGSTSYSPRDDQSTLSDTAASLMRALNSSEVRSVRIGALQLAIASGTYRVSAVAIADRVINSMVAG
jgi:negative regulator of flagellin synthesis FlgM